MQKGQFLFASEIRDSLGNVNKVIYDNTFSISLIMLKKILIKAILELIATYMEVFKNRVWMFI